MRTGHPAEGPALTTTGPGPHPLNPLTVSKGELDTPAYLCAIPTGFPWGPYSPLHLQRARVSSGGAPQGLLPPRVERTPWSILGMGSTRGLKA